MFLSNFAYAQDLTPEEIYEKVNDAVVVILTYIFNGDFLNRAVE